MQAFFCHGTHFFAELMYSRLNNYFTIITKEKLHFSLVCSFYFCLAKEGWALKAAEQFTMRGLVAYKPVAYKKNLILSAAACLFPKKLIPAMRSFKGKINIYIENSQPPILSTLLCVTLTLKFAVMQFCQRIFFIVF